MIIPGESPGVLHICTLNEYCVQRSWNSSHAQFKASKQFSRVEPKLSAHRRKAQTSHSQVNRSGWDSSNPESAIRISGCPTRGSSRNRGAYDWVPFSIVHLPGKTRGSLGARDPRRNHHTADGERQGYDKPSRTAGYVQDDLTARRANRIATNKWRNSCAGQVDDMATCGWLMTSGAP